MSFSRRDFLKIAGMGTVGMLTGRGASVNTAFKPGPELIFSNRITRNSTLGLISPASPVYDPKDFDEMLINVKNMGFTLKLGKHVRDRWGFLAGSDKDRAQDLMDMFADPNVDAILCVRGGWGCNRILEHIDFDIIKNNPKPLIGFSDITSLHMSIQAKTGVITFHGPVGTSEWNNFTTNSFDNALIDAEPQTYIIPEEDLKGAYVINPGKASGKILGGNLTVFTAMLGSEYLPDFKGSILFVEEVSEAVYRVDRMMTQLRTAGILKQIKGFIFGRCTDCSEGGYGMTLKEVLEDHIKPLGIPAFYGAMISHEAKNVTIPVGMNVEMDADNLSFKVDKPAVK